MVRITPSVWYLAVLEFISYGHTKYSLFCDYADDIYCNEYVFTSNIRFTGIFGFNSSFGVTTSTPNIPLLLVGLLLRLLSEAVRCSLLVRGVCAFLLDSVYSLFSPDDQALKLLGFTSLVLSIQDSVYSLLF